MVLVNHPGGKLTQLCTRTSGVAGKGVTHAWMALVNLRGEVVAVTGDHNAMEKNTVFEWEVAEPLNLNLPPGLYYAVIVVAATETMPTLVADSGSGTTIGGIPPILMGLSATVGLTTPLKVGESLPIPTAVGALIPYMWGA